MKFSETLKQQRIEKGWTQKELAEKLFISRSAVAKWEQGRGYPSLEMLEKLSEIFQLSIDELLSEKEFRSMSISCDQRTKANARFNRIILIGGCLIFVAIICLFLLFFSLKSNKANLYNFEFYATVNVEENGLKLTSIDCHYGFFEETDSILLKNSELDELTVYDKYGKGLNASELRSGERVLVSYTSEKDYRLQDMNIYHIDVIDDYLEGDYYSYGFFISTEAVDYEKPPIYDSDSGYDESVLEWQGEASSLSYRYPYVKERYNGFSAGPMFHEPILRLEKFNLAYAKYDKDYVISKEVNYLINVSNRVKKLYVYALDNSEKGYALAKEVEFSQKFFIETGALFNEAEKENRDHAYKIDMTFVIEVEFSFGIESVTIEEYDKNGDCIYKTDYYTADNLESETIHSKYITQDDMRYVDLYVDYYIGEEEKPLRSFISWGKARGDEIKIPIETYYGYLISKTVKIY